jgi:DNA-binding CsgD family transcriptional regulator
VWDRASDVELFERDGELRVLGRSIERGLRSDGTLLLIEGPAGIGKSALLERGQRLAQRTGVRVLSARGGVLEHEFAYGVVRQLFEPALRDMSGRRRRELSEGAAALAAPVVALAGSTPVTSRMDRGNPFALVHGLYWLTANMAAREPLAVIVDDAHWADSPSQRFLLYLARRLEGLAVTVVVATRPGEAEPRSVALTQLGAQPAAVVVRPAALSPQAVAQLVERGLRASPDQSFVAACHVATGGTPFLVEELVRALAIDGFAPTAEMAARVEDLGPATVARATLLMLARLPAAATALAQAVAVLGNDARLDRAARLAALDETETVDAADALVAMRVLRPGQPFAFVHPIVRTAVYEDLPPGRRSAAHLRAARILEADGASVDAVVAHLLCTEPGRRVRVIDPLRAGATGAIRRGAPEIATVCLRRALAEAGGRKQRARLLCELAAAEKLTRDPSAIGHFEEAMRLESDPLRRARMAGDLGEMLAFSGVWEPVPALLDAAVAEVGERDTELVSRLDAIRAAMSAYDARLVGELDANLPRLRAAAHADGTAARELSLLLAAIVAARCAPASEVLDLVERGLDDGRLLQDEGAGSWVLPQGVMALVMVDEFDRAAILADAMVADAQQTGSIMGFVSGVAHRALVEVRRGDLIAAEADLRDALESARQHDLQIPIAVTLWYGADAIVERPELDDVAAVVETLDVPEPLRPTFTGAAAVAVRGRVRLVAGNVTGAVDDLRGSGQTIAKLGLANPNLSGWRSELALAVAGREPTAARELADDQLRDARRTGSAIGIGVALRNTALLAGGEAGFSMLAEAAEALERSPARLEYARALVEFGAALRRANHRAAARDPLRRGLDLAHSCGATRLTERARTELAATGARPRRVRVTGRDALTPSQLRIARMAVDGLSNREIAQALFVTAKTVENHLGRIYRKLGVTRSGLAEALEREPTAV